MITVSELLSQELDVLLLAFFNIHYTDNDKNFYINGSFSHSQYSGLTTDGDDFKKQRDSLAAKFARDLDEYYSLPFTVVETAVDEASVTCKIVNDQRLSFDELVNSLYLRIVKKESMMADKIEFDSKLAFSMIILRGSPDFGSYYTLELVRKVETPVYLDCILKVLILSSDLLEKLNVNFRKFQPQYREGKKRGTQLRPKLRWCYENLLPLIKLVNSYKYNILISNNDAISKNMRRLKDGDTYVDRFRYYTKNVIDRELTDEEVSAMRADVFNEKNPEQRRNKAIKLYIENSVADECSACHNKYSIENRSFIVPRDGRYYFEYHHVISFSNDQENLDIADNLVKLCATCHRAMTPNRAKSDYQKELIKNILEHRSDVLDFAKVYFEESCHEQLVELIFEKLR